jgi:hypothetical protein
VNAERLNAIAQELREDFAVTEAALLLDQLANYLNAYAANPADPTASEQVASARRQLSERLSASRTNTFSDSWRLTLEELGIWDLTGDRLRDRIEEIFRRNEITPQIAAEEMTDLNSRIQTVSKSVDGLVDAFEAFDIGAEKLAPGAFEVGFLIPREVVGNEVERLGQEFEELSRILKPFMELAGGGRPDLEVRSISSSDFMLFLGAFAGFAQTVAKVVESLLTSYGKIRTIREKAAELEEAGVPDDALEDLRAHASDRMKIDINALTDTVIGQATADISPERQRELHVEVKRSLTRMANRIDEGYSIEVRSFTPPDDDDEEAAEGVSEESVRAAREITERQPRMRTMNLTGRPILELPEGDAPPARDAPDPEEPND